MDRTWVVLEQEGGGLKLSLEWRLQVCSKEEGHHFCDLGLQVVILNAQTWN